MNQGAEDKELFQLSNGRYIMSEELSDKMFYIKRIQPEAYQSDNSGYCGAKMSKKEDFE